MDNSCDKGYLSVLIKGTGDDAELCEIGFTKNPGEKSFWVDYENGKIFIVYDEEQDVIGTYETSPGPLGYNVYDYPSKRLIGRVGEGLISFIRKDVDHAAGRFMPEEECLAYYKKSGSIKPINNILANVGLIYGSEIGGAAAFVALFYNYSFKSVFRDYFAMDDAAFKEKYDAYLNFLGF